MKIHNPLKSNVPTKTWNVTDYEHALSIGAGEKCSAYAAATMAGLSPFFFDGCLPDMEQPLSHFFPESYDIPEIRLDVLPYGMTTGAGFIFTDSGHALWHNGTSIASSVGFLAEWSELDLLPAEAPSEYNCTRLNAYLPLEGAYQIACTAVGNYHHLMIDVIPRLWALQQEDTRNFIREHGFDPDRIPIIINHYAPYVADHIEMLGLGIHRERIIPIPHNGCVRANKLFVPHCLNSVFGRWSSGNLLKYYNDISQKLGLKRHDSSTPKKIFHLRRDITNDRRAIKNVNEISDFLLSYGFEELSPDAMNPREGWSIFANATHIVGAMGSNLSNSIFCQAGTRILNIQSDASSFSIVSSIAAAAKHDIGYLFGKSDPETGSGEQVRFEVDMHKIKPAIEALLDA